MKTLELTKPKAEDLNTLCRFALELGLNQPFGIPYFQSHHKEYTLEYCRHLVDVARQYEGVSRLINLEDNAIAATHNTASFLDSGGWHRILKIEQRDDKIQDYTLTTLRQTTLGTIEWLKVAGATIFIAFITSLLSGRLLEKSSPPDSSQVQLVQQLSRYISYQDSLAHLHNSASQNGFNSIKKDSAAGTTPTGQ